MGVRQNVFWTQRLKNRRSGHGGVRQNVFFCWELKPFLLGTKKLLTTSFGWDLASSFAFLEKRRSGQMGVRHYVFLTFSGAILQQPVPPAGLGDVKTAFGGTGAPGRAR